MYQDLKSVVHVWYRVHVWYSKGESTGETALERRGRGAQGGRREEGGGRREEGGERREEGGGRREEGGERREEGGGRVRAGLHPVPLGRTAGSARRPPARLGRG